MEMETLAGSNAPHWDLTPIYNGYEDDRYQEDIARVTELTQNLTELLEHQTETVLTSQVGRVIDLYNQLGDTYETLYAYVYTRYSTDTTDEATGKEMSRMQNLGLPVQRALVLMKEKSRNWKGSALPEYQFFLQEQAFLAEKQMPLPQEELAADLNRAGGEAWSKLHGSLSSTLTAPWKNGERKTVNDLRSLAFDENREIRKKAFEAELEAWKSVEIPLAAALNGVKGFTHSLNSRRKWESTLAKSIHQARITPATLEALIGAMEKNLPTFRKYLKIKAGALGVSQLAFYDLFAPVGQSNKVWTWKEAADFIVTQFGKFSKEMASFAREAFDKNWLDGETREGKVGGAYCISFPDRRVSRILCNFNGSFTAVKTIAHELGHAYHHHVLKEAPHVHRDYPMTLAETASIFAENIVFNAALAEASDQEKGAILEEDLQSSTQVIVDILSRFYFEKAVMERRAQGELSPNEFSQLMLQAQIDTYGEGLDPEALHPYMWAVKGHYYRTGLSFYNFPYAFGQLFGMALYARFKQEGKAFVPVYNEILAGTGKMTAVELTKEAGFDIESEAFWQSGLDLIAQQVEDLGQIL